MKRKILIIVENLPVPFDTRVWKEARSLHENGYEVTTLSPRGKGCERRHEVIDGIHIYRHRLPKEGDSFTGYLWEYSCALFWQFVFTWWIYFRRGFKVIQGCNPPDTIFLVVLPFKLLGVKYIFDHHDANPELYLSKFGKKGLAYRAQLWLEKLTYRSSDVVMATNGSYKELALTRGGLNPDDVFIVRNGPDLRTFKAMPPNPDLKHGKPCLVGYVGTMGVQEGLDILLDIALHIKGLGRRDIHFTCAGRGPALASLRRMVVEKGLGDMVTFTGRVPDQELLAILSTADVCVNPDKPCEMNNISTMNKIMEYMALGKPIVQFDVREGRASAREASLYADSENPVTDFAAKILWLLDHPEARQKMGEFGRKRVQQELAWQYSVKNLVAAYERAFTKGARSEAVPKRVAEVIAGSRQKTATAAAGQAQDLHYAPPIAHERTTESGPMKSGPYIYKLPTSVSFTTKGLLGYMFGPLRQPDLELFYVEVEKGHDTFMVSKRITRTYYILSGSGYFTIDNHRHNVSPGMLVEVPPKVEYSYSGKMSLIGISKPRWFASNDTHTRWNPDVVRRDSYVIDRGSWPERLLRARIFGKSPVGFYLRLNQSLWNRLSSHVTALAPVRLYGAFLHGLARRQGIRALAFSTHFLRNRPELELIRRLVEGKARGETLRVAVLGCSTGAEAYSVAWRIRSARPDLNLMLHAVDISKQAVEFGKRGVYSLRSAEISSAATFERVTPAEMDEMFDRDRETAAVKGWIREGIDWHVGDAGEPRMLDQLGPQDMVLANNFLCHMDPSEAEPALRNIARLVSPGGYLFVSGIDLEVRSKVARDLKWKPVPELLEEIHEGDPCLRNYWPCHYGGLEPLDKKQNDWRVRYAAAFQIGSRGEAPPARDEATALVATDAR